MKHLGKWKSIINWKNGRIHGEFIYLYPNKSIKTKGVFKNGKIDKSEKFEYYNPDGSDLSDNQYAFFAEEDEFKYQEKNWTKRYAWGR